MLSSHFKFQAFQACGFNVIVRRSLNRAIHTLLGLSPCINYARYEIRVDSSGAFPTVYDLWHIFGVLS